MNSGLLAILLLIAMSLSFTVIQLHKIGDQVEESMDTRVVKMQLGDEIQRAFATQGMFIRAYFLDPTDNNLERLEHGSVKKVKTFRTPHFFITILFTEYSELSKITVGGDDYDV
ncbi:hypothetical protein [Solibacillus sp. CAU 1738]|uniref:hypothetical protein n=1 Tax=Solibacillus sp. CAU 1738 TaxID=3140363 RepID=UPI003260BED1